MKATPLLLLCGISSLCFGAVSFDDVMAASRHASEVCDSRGAQSIDCIIASHALQQTREQYERDRRTAEMERMQHPDSDAAPRNAEARVRATDALYLGAYASTGQ